MAWQNTPRLNVGTQSANIHSLPFIVYNIFIVAAMGLMSRSNLLRNRTRDSTWNFWLYWAKRNWVKIRLTFCLIFVTQCWQWCDMAKGGAPHSIAFRCMLYILTHLYVRCSSSEGATRNASNIHHIISHTQCTEFGPRLYQKKKKKVKKNTKRNPQQKLQARVSRRFD